ncbi:MAG TPA: FHA domain-containing protein [Lacipirellulaceae bacterium]|jgi:pSer/pThr/pTyr-binding forkhead associated (FHA) protein
MVDHGEPATAGDVSLLLLDSAQGHPVQSWRFSDHSQITIGREQDNDVVIADPHVSRIHARLVAFEGSWTLISMGRHGVLVNDRLVADIELRPQTIFRLGPSGPSLRFETGTARPSYGETLENINPDTLSLLEVDEQRKQQEVEQIAGGALFEDLLEQSRRLRSERQGGNDSE